MVHRVHYSYCNAIHYTRRTGQLLSYCTVIHCKKSTLLLLYRHSLYKQNGTVTVPTLSEEKVRLMYRH